MKTTIKTTKSISSAHYVHTAGDDSPCVNLHGHNWKVDVEITGQPAKDGMIVDFRKIKNIINQLDHKTLIPEGTVLNKSQDHLSCACKEHEFILPQSSCVIVPIKSITAENLSAMIGKSILELVIKENEYPTEVIITVWETDKSWARTTHE